MNSGYYENCLEDQVFAATPLELVRMLYRGAIDALGDAENCLENGDIEGRSRAINKSCAILVELTSSLDRSAGQGMSGNLAELYDYMMRSVLEAHTRQTAAPLIEVRGLLSTILEGWAKCEAEPMYVPVHAMESRHYEMQVPA